jgi:hypothetical protein
MERKSEGSTFQFGAMKARLEAVHQRLLANKYG